MTWDAFLGQLAAWFAQRDLLTSNARWVVAVSGGPDSTLLLHALHAVSQRQALGWALHVAHLHHGLRGADADADAEFVRELAGQLDRPYHEERADVPARVRADGGSIEDAARSHRYEFLERVALQTGSDCVAVGHHADDQAETVLHRICRGTGLRGLAGMADIRAIRPGSRIRVVRPLLAQRRATIASLCAERGMATRCDRTNEGTEFTRSRIRNVVLPLLRETLNPNVSDALLRLAEQARWLGTYLEDAAARTLESLLISETPHEIVLNTSALLRKQRIIQAEVIRRAVSLVVGREQDLSFSHIETVLQLASDRGSGKELHLPGAIVVRKQYDRLVFQPRSQAHQERPPEFTPVCVNCPGRTALPALGGELIAEIRDIDAGQIEELRRGAGPYEEWLDLEHVRLPLIVRGRRAGDRFRPLGAPGTKTLGDFFIDEKVDPPLRVRTGVLCDQDGPIWVIPLRIDERVKLRRTTQRALRLVLRLDQP